MSSLYLNFVWEIERLNPHTYRQTERQTDVNFFNVVFGIVCIVIACFVIVVVIATV